MATPRWLTRVLTRITGGQVSASSDNAVEDRVVQLAADVACRRCISAAAFVSQDGAQGTDRECSLYLVNQYPGTSTRVFEAHVDLLHGLSISELKLWGNIWTDSGSFVTVRLLRVAHADAAITQIGADCTITGSTGDLSQAVVLNHQVDTGLYSYKVRATLYNATASGQARLYAVSVN